MKTCANDSWLFICVFIYAVWLGGVSDGQEAARQQIPLMAPMHRSNLIARLWGEVGADHPWSQALKWRRYPELFHLCLSRWNNCMQCPYAWACVCSHTWAGLNMPFSLGTAGGLHSWKEWGFLKPVVKEAVCAHGKMMWNESSHVFARATKTANKTAQWANWVVQSETENAHKGP